MRWLIAAVLLVLLALASNTSADPDLWGHLRFGLDSLRTHTLPSVDPYSFTQDVPWVNHEWLSEIQMGTAYRLGGIAGLAFLKGLLASAVILLVWFAFRGAVPIVRMIAVGGTIVGCGWILSNLRPQLWSLLLLTLVGRILTSDSKYARWWLPLILLVWANLHGGWIVGFAVVSTWAAMDVAVTRRGVAAWVAIVGAAALSTLVTPYGTEIWRFLWQTVHVTRDIEEWKPLWRWPPMSWIGWSMAMVAAILVNARANRFRWQSTAVLVTLAYFSLRVSRVAPLFVVSAAMLLAPAIRERWALAKPLAFDGARERVTLSVLAVLLAVSAIWIGARSFTCISVTGDWIPPQGRLAALENAPAGRLVTHFNWGEYAIWHLGPRIRVSMDGRRETVYSDRRLAEHDAIVAGTPEGLATLAAWNAEYVWLPGYSVKTKEWLVSHGYTIQSDARDSFLAVRSDLPILIAPAATASSVRCFPQ